MSEPDSEIRSKSIVVNRPALKESPSIEVMSKVVTCDAWLLTRTLPSSSLNGGRGGSNSNSRPSVTILLEEGAGSGISSGGAGKLESDMSLLCVALVATDASLLLSRLLPEDPSLSFVSLSPKA